MIRLQLGVLSFWLDVAGLLEWYDASCLVLSCLSGFTLVYLSDTMRRVLFCLSGFTSVYLNSTTTAGCLVLFCLVFLALRWFT